MQSPSHKELVINWHITEACNYSCRYCYAHWCKNKQRELIHNTADTKALLLALSQYFSPKSVVAPAQLQHKYSSIRLNIAGGEPLLYPQHVKEVLQTAHELGMRTSLITNGSLLDNSLISFLAHRISMLGISIDSTNADINRKIGRDDQKGNQLNTNALTRYIQLALDLNPSLRIKLNTVVNQENWDDDLTALVSNIKPKRWKVLRMLPVINNDLAITDHQFQSFINRHHQHKVIMAVEDNDDMTESYLMIDPLGRFFQNIPGSSKQGYRYSDPILSVGINKALESISFSSSKFIARYEEKTA